MRIYIFLLVILSSNICSSQKIVDTLKTEEGTMLIYANRTWEYLEDHNFDGVMNERLHLEVTSNTNLNYIQNWDHDMCYTSNLANDVNKLKDTIWLCLQDEQSDKFVMPFNGTVTSGFGWRKGRKRGFQGRGLYVKTSAGLAVRIEYTWVAAMHGTSMQ